MDKVSLTEYWDMLEAHDWYHDWSDDGRVANQGAANWTKLMALSKQSPDHAAMLAAFHQHYWTGKPWNTEQKPKPARPEPKVVDDSDQF